jgi:CheY-like chemotaxis protein
VHVQAAKVSSSDCTIIEKHKINNFVENEEERIRSYWRNLSYGGYKLGKLSKKILVVNDETDINATVRHVLEDRGFKVDSYEDPRLALENFKPQYYDLVIIDSKMPQMNGFAFYKEVRAIEPNVKTCFLTAADVQPDHYSDDSFSSPPPANCFIRIPIENESLIERIEEIMAEVK